MLTTQKQIREMFWDAFPEFAVERRSRKKQNDYHCDIRCAFVDYVDMLCKNGVISAKLAWRATL